MRGESHCQSGCAIWISFSTLARGLCKCKTHAMRAGMKLYPINIGIRQAPTLFSALSHYMHIFKSLCHTKHTTHSINRSVGTIICLCNICARPFCCVYRYFSILFTEPFSPITRGCWLTWLYANAQGLIEYYQYCPLRNLRVDSTVTSKWIWLLFVASSTALRPSDTIFKTTKIFCYGDNEQRQSFSILFGVSILVRMGWYGMKRTTGENMVW